MRRRFIQLSDGTLVEASNAPPVERRADAGVLWGDRGYAGLRATDGTPIDTRTKHRAYMRERGLTTVDDFAGSFERAARERARFFEGAPDPERGHEIARAWERQRG